MTVRPLILAAALALTGCQSLFRDDGVRVSPSAYRPQVERCVAAADAATGLPCKGLRRAYFAETGKRARSQSLGRDVAVDDAGRAGWWVSGEIHVYTLNGQAPDEVVTHEVAHQIAADNGLPTQGHCPQFKGKVWGW